MDARIPDVGHLIEYFKDAIFVSETGTDEGKMVRKLG